ncbi:MAG: signal peptide peptidase SppA [Candidatus Cloacimonetes bacterium HGW-Cloacimonetes-3]|jgi:protease-4|nr:MAG: signal peptide peptidase SppA [Candidatus Cloacimonetes bacterium HGW-Cloacimonetes-3]
MKILTKLGILIMVLCVGGVLKAQSSAYGLDEFDFPIAGIDNLFIPISNPSLLGTGNANGFGIAHLNIEEKWQKHYWLLFNSDSFSYIYERNNGESFHTLATGGEMLPKYVLPNLYAGTNYRWHDGDFKEGHFRSGVSYRPADFASLALTWDNPYKDSPYYRAGLALRPFAVTDAVADYRLELSADMNYAKEAGDYKAQKPVLGIQTQVLNGLMLGASYNMESESTMLNFSIGAKTTSAGTSMHSKNDDNYGIAWAHFTEENFKPFLGITPKTWYSMKLSGNIISYKSPKYKFGPFSIFDSKDKSVEDVINEINKAKNDPAVHGIFLKNPSFSTSFALQQELLDAFAGFKSTGKKVSFYFDNISNGGYIFAASIADEIYLNPMGSVDLRGLSITSPYLKDLLSTLGIETLNFRSHKYKNAGNMFSETEMTAPEREVYESILQSFYSQITDRINLGRGKRLNDTVENIIDQGPYFQATDALDKGLVDGLVYADEVNKKLKEDSKFSMKTSTLVNYRNYDWSSPKENQIAVIYTSGNIVMGKGTPGQKIAHETTVNLIRKARKNKSYKGIILRVDSGGGSAQASDIILRELELAQTEDKKPVVVSMAGVAASGGYYIACKADRIVADPATITGSIGVIGLVFNATEMFKKIKVNWSTVKKGENADMGSLYRPWKDGEKDMLTRSIERTYEDFVKKVDQGRKTMNLEQVHQHAQGRVWTGAQALEIGLIDDLGGLDVAVDNMREVSGIKGKIRLVDATTSDQGLSVTMSSSPLMKLLPIKALEVMSADYIQLYELWEDFASDKALMLCPYVPETIEF